MFYGIKHDHPAAATAADDADGNLNEDYEKWKEQIDCDGKRKKLSINV